ncbi:unnamed protein product [Ascophyllum nodosum]
MRWKLSINRKRTGTAAAVACIKWHSRKMEPLNVKRGTTPIDRIRVVNGYGIRTSALSASLIGDFDSISEKRKAINRKWEGVYQTDANFQISQMNGKHPMRKVLHMQSFYPATIRRLSDKLSTISNVAPDGTKHTDSRDPKAKAAVSSASGRGPRHLPSSSNSSKNKAYFSPTTASAALATVAPSQERSLLTTGRSSRSGSTSRLASIKRCSRESREMRRRATQEEYSFCHGKMRYNRARGRGAEVNGIITGNAPLEVKMPLFPARATHQQLLGLVHRPSHPDKPAPEVPRERKWLGDSVGWEGS